MRRSTWARAYLLGIGGSATTDGGIGALAALGVRLRDRDGAELAPEPASFAELAELDVSGLDARLRGSHSRSRPMSIIRCRARGASAVFGPQKGASPEAVAQLDAALNHFASVAAATLGADRRNEPGTGAAGGLGFCVARVYAGAPAAGG